jgi:small subunit ribosomal protein S4
MKLFLKGERCFSTKCSIERRSYAPGQHGQRQRKVSDYGVRLREKQKMKHLYGLQETQFRNYFLKAAAARGITGEVLIQSLERRLDNVVYRCGFASSRREARQNVLHGIFLVNGKAVNIPSYLVRKGDRVQPVDGHKRLAAIREAVEVAQHRGVPSWIELDREKLTGRVIGIPSRDAVQLPVKEQLIVELYSK